MRKIFPLLLVLQSCIGAGDMLASKEQITGNYYLIERDDGAYDICYKVDGSYMGRNASNSKVVAYAIEDSIMVIKSQDYQSDIVFYVLNMNRDNGYSKNEEIYLDTIPERLFKKSWVDKNGYKFIPVR